MKHDKHGIGAEKPFYQTWDELITRLYQIIGEDEANLIINEVKAEANIYDMLTAIERMHRIISILLKGIPVSSIMPFIRNQEEDILLSMLELGYTCNDKSMQTLRSQQEVQQDGRNRRRQLRGRRRSIDRN